MNQFKPTLLCSCAAVFLAMGIPSIHAQDAAAAPEIRTPPIPPTPRINGPGIFGVRPDHPFLYHIPATGDRPMTFSADQLPDGLTLDAATGNITGRLSKTGNYQVTFHAKNSLGTSDKKFKIVVGEAIDLTPAMGWNSWNHYASRITQDIVLQNAKAMAGSGLIDHGWSYVNIDDTWQGRRGGPFHGLQGNDKFPGYQGTVRPDSRAGIEVRNLFDAVGNFLRGLSRRQFGKSRRQLDQTARQARKEQKHPALRHRQISFLHQ
jgi:alpha-galactosidase